MYYYNHKKIMIKDETKKNVCVNFSHFIYVCIYVCVLSLLRLQVKANGLLLPRLPLPPLPLLLLDIFFSETKLLLLLNFFFVSPFCRIAGRISHRNVCKREPAANTQKPRLPHNFHVHKFQIYIFIYELLLWSH